MKAKDTLDFYVFNTFVFSRYQLQINELKQSIRSVIRKTGNVSKAVAVHAIPCTTFILFK